jgi:hypothetical protein
MFKHAHAGLVTRKMILKPTAAEVEHQKRQIKAPAAVFATGLMVSYAADAGA